MGVWGMASLLGKAAGSVMGGAVVDGVLWVTGGAAFHAYATVFALEAALLTVALVLTYRLRVEASRASQEADPSAQEADASAKPAGPSAA